MLSRVKMLVFKTYSPDAFPSQDPGIQKRISLILSLVKVPVLKTYYPDTISGKDPCMPNIYT